MANGVYSNAELIDTLIVDLNNLLSKAVAGQYIQACGIVSAMAQKLVNLRDSIPADLAGKDRVIEELKAQLRNMGATVVDMTPEEYIAELKKDGANDGSN